MLDLGSVADRLAKNKYDLDDASHIELDQALAKSTRTDRLLLRVCAAQVYSEAPDGSIAVQHAACLECGTCLAVAAPGTLRWRYPSGGRGVAYREG
jgi:ferredoxin like protein